MGPRRRPHRWTLSKNLSILLMVASPIVSIRSERRQTTKYLTNLHASEMLRFSVHSSSVPTTVFPRRIPSSKKVARDVATIVSHIKYFAKTSLQNNWSSNHRKRSFRVSKNGSLLSEMSMSWTRNVTSWWFRRSIWFTKSCRRWSIENKILWVYSGKDPKARSKPRLARLCKSWTISLYSLPRLDPANRRK